MEKTRSSLPQGLVLQDLYVRFPRLTNHDFGFTARFQTLGRWRREDKMYVLKAKDGSLGRNCLRTLLTQLTDRFATDTSLEDPGIHPSIVSAGGSWGSRRA